MKPLKATIMIQDEDLAEWLSEHMRCRYESMVKTYGEACTKTTAAKVISVSVQTINAMLADGRIRHACAGTRVDVRSLADYIEKRDVKNHEARIQKSGRKRYV